jgi:hypothetical protein
VQGGAGAAQPQQPQPPSAEWRPNVTVPRLLAFGAFGLYAILALFASDSAEVSSRQLDEIGTLTTFLIADGRAPCHRGTTRAPGIAQLKRI